MNRRVQGGLLIIIFLSIILYLYHTVPTSQPLQSNTIERRHEHPRESILEKGREKSDEPDIKYDVDLPQTVIDRVKTFVFFLGRARSGHSIVGSLMDSHPHVVISHELDLFKRIPKGVIAPTKSAIFNAVWKNTKKSINASMKYSIRTRSNKGYTLLVEGLYQGRYVDYIDVIGDKKAGATTDVLREEPKRWSSVFNILKSLGVTLKVIHVIRNPYDNIATAILFHELHRAFRGAKRSNKTYKINSTIIDISIHNHFINHKTVVDAKKKYHLDIIEIHGKDLISNPRGTLIKLCNYLGVTCSDKYLEICSNKIYKSESRTRDKIEWTDSQIKTVQENIEKYDCLKGYSFDSL